ncbi:MAG: SPBc2 prophage-derived glycosyltransferase SunS [Actinomycetota bacterium]|jgi:hypothetical protein
MNIVLISSFDEKTPATYLLDSLKKRGINVFAIGTQNMPFIDVVRSRGFKLKTILAQKQLEPDLLIYVEGGSTSLFPTDLAQLNFPCLWWGIDTHNNYDQHLMISRVFSHSLIAQKSFVAKLSQDGIQNVTWMPLAAPIYKVDDSTNAKKYDVAYVGSTNWKLYPQRKIIYDLISKNFTNFYFGPAQPKVMMEIYANSKVVINHSLMNDINMRIFEALGAGALLLTNQIHDNGLDELLVKGKDFDIYFDENDLLEKINLYLENETLRAKIAKSGHELVTRNHTYDQRVNFILSRNFSNLNQVSVRTLDFMNVLISLGYLKDAFENFSLRLESNFEGKRNKIVYKIFSIFAKPLLIFLKIISIFIYRIKVKK